MGDLTHLVAGGAGFVGSHLCDRLLAEGHRVICVDSFITGSEGNVAALENHPRFRLVRQDIRRPLPVAERVDRVWNLACPASPPAYQADPFHTMMTNVVGTEALLRFSARQGARFLQASTSEVYGDPEEHPQREEYRGRVSCTGSRACYDEGKRAAEALCFDARRVGAVDVRVARIFNTYGPRMRPDDGRIVSNLIVQALTGAPMTVYGRGEQTRSFCHVRDMVEGLIRLMAVEPAPDGPVNIGNPGEFTVADLAAIVRRLVPTASPLVYRPLPEDDPQRRRPDIGRARALLGWEPGIGLEQGLADTADWFSMTLDCPPRRGVAAGE